MSVVAGCLTIYNFCFIFLDEKGEELKTFYYNYQLLNHAGGKVDISFYEFGRLEKVTLDSDDVLNWFRVFRAREDPYFVLRATNKSNGAPLKMNGMDQFEMFSHSSRYTVSVIDISSDGKRTLLNFLIH